MVFSIMFENEVFKQWEDKYIFKSYIDAKKYLTDRGFVERNSLFYHNDNMKAFISPRELWIS